MPPSRRGEPMAVKYWSFAGLMLTYWCNARCASCYLCCGPGRTGWMSVEFALRLWRELIDASPHGCRIHLSGGEPFGDFPRLLELCRRAKSDRLAPLDKIETNAFWATDERLVRQRLKALDEAGMRKLGISADPYHQQFVPIERCRLLARVACETLGAERVQVRWRDWLHNGHDTHDLGDPQRSALFARYAVGGRDRLNGRAVETISRYFPRKNLAELADKPCRNALLRSRHVHVDPCGRVMAGTCAGILLGRCDPSGGEGVADVWRRLDADYASRPIVGTLAERGPTGLLHLARDAGFKDGEGYANKCHLCWELRRFLALRGLGGEELGPRRLYVPHEQTTSSE